MDSKRFLLCAVTFSVVFLFTTERVSAGLQGDKLFVFGSTHVDTGNTANSSFGWRQPYGITYPGVPSGRMSDGRVWSDFMASHLGLSPPVPYHFRNGTDQRAGMNFAYAGTGVFKTKAKYPTMTTQINRFQKMVKRVYIPSVLTSAVALVSVSGDDLDHFIDTQPGRISNQDWNNFQMKTVNQIIQNVRKIESLGVKTIAVNSLPPLGCLPYLSSGNSYRTCNPDANRLAMNQNQMLKDKLTSLAREKPQAKFYYVDLYTSWNSILNSGQFNLRPCCSGSNDKSGCGTLDGKRLKMYSLCSKPDSSFFWDKYNPTQNGWTQVYSVTKNTFNPL